MLKRPLRTVLPVLMLALLLCRTANGHNMNLFATVEDGQITGSVYFARGGAAQKVKVEIFAPADKRAGQTVTDAEGAFSFTPALRCDHLIIATTADGHQARYTVPRAELPKGLPAPDPGAGKKAADDGVEQQPELDALLGEIEVIEAGPEASIELIVERAVARQIAPLRREIREYEQRVRLHDILGGIGYIVGVTGLAFYLLGSRRKKRGARIMQ